MSKKSEAIARELDASYVEQANLYQQIISNSVDQAAAAALLRHLESNTIRRQNTQRELDKELAKPGSIFDQFFG